MPLENVIIKYIKKKLRLGNSMYRSKSPTVHGNPKYTTRMTEHTARVGNPQCSWVHLKPIFFKNVVRVNISVSTITQDKTTKM